jgi:hypothetical protein
MLKRVSFGKKRDKMGGNSMQRQYFAVVFIVFSGFFAFADAGEPEELDFLLFLPNSAESFADKERAMIQLDTVANYILGKNPTPGQIYVYGYSADVVNDIDPVDLSKERALLVMEQLRKRGIAQELFSDPVAYGSVNLWGNNIDEAHRLPNRRVRIVFDGAVLTQAILAPVESEIFIPVADGSETVEMENVTKEELTEKSDSKFPWIWLLLLIPLALLLFLLFRLKRKTVKPAPVGTHPPVIDDAPTITPAVVATSITTNELVVNLDNEILFRAYELYLLRYGQGEDDVNDWYRAVMEVCSRYDASGYQTYRSEGSWWARKTIVLQH